MTKHATLLQALHEADVDPLHIPKFAEIFDIIDSTPQSCDLIPGRHISYAHATKHVIVGIASYRFVAHNLFCIALLEMLDDRNRLVTAFDTMRIIYALPARFAEKSAQEIGFLGLELFFSHDPIWTYPRVKLSHHLATNIHIPLSAHTQKECYELAGKLVRDMMREELGEQVECKDEINDISAVASDCLMKVELFEELLHAHPEDIKRWVEIERANHRLWIEKIRAKATESAMIREKLQQHISEWFERNKGCLPLYHEHELARRPVSREQAHMQVSVRFVYHAPASGKVPPRPVHYYVCALDFLYADRKHVEIIKTDNINDLFGGIEEYLGLYQYKVEQRLAYHIVVDPMDHEVDPIYGLLLRHSRPEQIAELIEKLRNDDEKFPEEIIDLAGDQSIKSHDASLKPGLLEGSFFIAEHAKWMFDTLYITTYLPNAVINGLPGKSLRAIIGMGDLSCDKAIGDRIVLSATQGERDVIIKLDHALIRIGDMFNHTGKPV